ncbi:unnamed protein product [Phyllotreta striolata]|uniref:Uncharacterized protein n=1 Tax=Phyllotreta striolata TaxID=444603 RepID=A0A9N9TTV9_PHYSR|nr:unnamed protein product [Phyllotreta striolata]
MPRFLWLLPAILVALCNVATADDQEKVDTLAKKSISEATDAKSSPEVKSSIGATGKSLKVVASPATSTNGPIEYYKTKYDHVDIEMLLNNRRMVNYYLKCMLNQAPCPPDGAEFKRILPDAIRTNCIRCTDKQKAVTIRAIKRLMKEYPKVWAQLAAAWDPQDVYVKVFLDTYNSFEYRPTTTTTTTSTTARSSFFDRFGGGDDDGVASQKKPATPGVLFNLPPLPTIPNRVLDKVEPFANGIGAGFTATVSSGTRLGENLLRGIVAVGNRAIETGAQIADVVVKSFTKPL